ncbi:Putative necrosis inducing protein [Colletotrichum destructivum]|uniref:Necrosis inducing protein n=1 Tax=Colletotrichum destructivum TaxID=34406 RepID=A0AAX4IL77_9PEZI|nr:Putative necrosis inducing protein [Colletotrichum destructivum]
MIPSTVLSAWAALLAVTTASPIEKDARNTLLRRKTPAKMNVCAPEGDKKWQPGKPSPSTVIPEQCQQRQGKKPELADTKQTAMDFDMDSCYNTPAGGCRDGPDLGSSNVYSRARCNNGWCAYMYGYYFEKDQMTVCLGHMHDWEHVVVFVEGGAPRYVSVSAHGRYTMRPWGDVLVEGTHVKVVYHKDGPGTHAFRFAKAEDDARQENHLGKWFVCDPPRSSVVVSRRHLDCRIQLLTAWQYGDLIGWNGFPSAAVREKMTGKSWGKAKIDFTDERFGDTLKSAIQAQGSTPYIVNMDADVDDGSPGMPAYCPNHFWRVE